MVCLRTLYTVAILGLGYKFILKYLHNIPISAYVVRNVFQLGFAFFNSRNLEKLNLKSLFCKRFKKYVASKLLFLQ
jgi:isopenicillin N synthase-like dioxygenase